MVVGGIFANLWGNRKQVLRKCLADILELVGLEVLDERNHVGDDGLRVQEEAEVGESAAGGSSDFGLFVLEEGAEEALELFLGQVVAHCCRDLAYAVCNKVPHAPALILRKLLYERHDQCVYLSNRKSFSQLDSIVNSLHSNAVLFVQE